MFAGLVFLHSAMGMAKSCWDVVRVPDLVNRENKLHCVQLVLVQMLLAHYMELTKGTTIMNFSTLFHHLCKT